MTGFNHTTITLEFGDPPAPNITAPPPPTVAQEIIMAGETNDSVDLEVSFIHRGMESSRGQHTCSMIHFSLLIYPPVCTLFGPECEVSPIGGQGGWLTL